MSLFLTVLGILAVFALAGYGIYSQIRKEAIRGDSPQASRTRASVRPLGMSPTAPSRSLLNPQDRRGEPYVDLDHLPPVGPDARDNPDIPGASPRPRQLA